MFKTFEEKISFAIDKIKTLKEEKTALQKRVDELEGMLRSREQEIEKLAAEKTSIKAQIENLFTELEAIEVR
ncbi:MAG: cell division protein ZapB [Nitrospirota bacterium]